MAGALERSRSSLLPALVAAAASACATVPQAPGPSGPIAMRFTTIDGRSSSLGRLRGKVVLVTVVKTWANAALLDVPTLKAMADRYADAPFAIVCVVLAQPAEMALMFAEAFELPYAVTVVDDPERFTSSQGPLGQIRVVPMSVLLDRTGVISVRMDGTWDPDVLKEAIHRLLAADPGSH